MSLSGLPLSGLPLSGLPLVSLSGLSLWSLSLWSLLGRDVLHAGLWTVSSSNVTERATGQQTEDFMGLAVLLSLSMVREMSEASDLQKRAAGLNPNRRPAGYTALWE